MAILHSRARLVSIFGVIDHLPEGRGWQGRQSDGFCVNVCRAMFACQRYITVEPAIFDRICDAGLRGRGQGPADGGRGISGYCYCGRSSPIAARHGSASRRPLATMAAAYPNCIELEPKSPQKATGRRIFDEAAGTKCPRTLAGLPLEASPLVLACFVRTWPISAPSTT